MVLLTGTLGRAAAAHYRRDAGGVLLVKPRIAEGMALARTNCVNACIDLSDGLSSALYQLARASNVGFLVNYDALPRSAALRKVPPELCERFVLHFGGDYELLFTAARENLPQIARALRGTKVTLIGEVIEGSEVLLTRKGGGRVVLPDEGYQHFREK
jgi:thiamine-monophosphate kinase